MRVNHSTTMTLVCATALFIGFLFSRAAANASSINLLGLVSQPLAAPPSALASAPFLRVVKIIPTSPNQVLERLPPRVINSVDPQKYQSAIATNQTTQGQMKQNSGAAQAITQKMDLQAVLVTASQQIALSRSTGDPRYLGRAQATLGKLWDSPNAPMQAMIFQATIEQSRHDFEAARRTLQRALKNANAQKIRPFGEHVESLQLQIAQAWLTLAAIERVTGNYPEALTACQQVAAFETGIYGKACLLETQSALGGKTLVISGFRAIIRDFEKQGNASSQVIAAATKYLATDRAWLYSLLAEAHERTGDDLQAAKAYATSLQIQPDLYTAIAAADLALRQPTQLAANASRALQVIDKVPETDAVLIRKALALKRLNNPLWRHITADLKERMTHMSNRGDDANAHAREQALVALWLTEEYLASLKLSIINLERQRETIDWMIAITAASKQADPSTIEVIRERLQRSKLIDARLVARND
jgi:tetratricopeptide (TPR) repeat protein